MLERAKNGKEARSTMTSAVLDAGASSNKALKFAINEAVDRQLLEIMEQLVFVPILDNFTVSSSTSGQTLGVRLSCSGV
jgi:hypothetical protein